MSESHSSEGKAGPGQCPSVSRAWALAQLSILERLPPHGPSSLPRLRACFYQLQTHPIQTLPMAVTPLRFPYSLRCSQRKKSPLPQPRLFPAQGCGSWAAHTYHAHSPAPTSLGPAFHGCLLSSPLVSLLTQYLPECTFMVFHDIKGVVWDLTDLFPVGLRKVFKRPGR